MTLPLTPSASAAAAGPQQHEQEIHRPGGWLIGLGSALIVVAALSATAMLFGRHPLRETLIPVLVAVAIIGSIMCAVKLVVWLVRVELAVSQREIFVYGFHVGVAYTRERGYRGRRGREDDRGSLHEEIQDYLHRRQGYDGGD